MDDGSAQSGRREAAAEHHLEAMLSAGQYQPFRQALCRYLLAKFDLDPDEGETDLYRLAILGLKRLLPPGSRREGVEGGPPKYDCHQADAAVRKKVLFIMHVERKLGIRFGDDESTRFESIDDLAAAAFAGLAAARGRGNA